MCIRDRVSVLDGVKEVFSKIEEKDGRIHAYLDTYKKEAYARAKEVEKGIEDGTYTGPLAGVPIAIKDNICVQGKDVYKRQDRSWFPWKPEICD